jgi:acyl-[acyl-carrier-protein]-phospholipid O-acyltransferase/long-chain-fatty-acid--[acyl-carrier-protein] ligase
LPDDIAARIERRIDTTLTAALLAAARSHTGPPDIILDADGRRLTYRDLTRGMFALGNAIRRMTGPGERVGVLLPTSAAGAVTFFALLAYGRVPAMLNFTAGRATLDAACAVAGVKTILTAKKFIDGANLSALAEGLAETHRVVHLEDVRAGLGLADKAAGLAGARLHRLRGDPAKPDDPAVILFTSGTEGKPKGVALSHRNILANNAQIDETLPNLKSDIFFNPLPIFHSYGLTGGTLLPLILGRQLVLHPSPLQTKAIPQRIRETGATILLATDTFLRQYARAGDQQSMNSLRFAVCGAERVRPETRDFVHERYGFVVIEGYGVTETAPVIAVNHPDDIRDGTVGRLLPGIEARLEPIDGLDDGRGRLFVRGPNVMLGYLSRTEPGGFAPPQDGWHDTGDVVSISPDGYLAIHGRLKRFAKIGGEMVSLAIVENCAATLWPDHLHTTAVVPAARKGEEIVLVTEYGDADAASLLAFAKARGLPELAVPKTILHVEAIPVLGTGKIAHAAVDALVRERLAAAPGRAVEWNAPQRAVS